MKNIENILAMSQETLKAYLAKLLSGKGYTCLNEEGFLYAIPRKNPISVLMVAHLDTVHKEPVKEIHKQKLVDGNTHVFSPQGIGGDDRCGVWAIMKLVQKGDRPYILFCEDEEIGNVGARKFKHKPPVKYMVELDRRGNKDAVFYSNDNREFIKWITEQTGFEEEHGSCSDISTLMPATGIAGVNLSCGYYNAHTKDEYIVLEELDNTIEVCHKLLAQKSEQWKYEEKKYSFGNWYSKAQQKSLWDYQKPRRSKFVSDDYVSLVVEVDSDYAMDGYFGEQITVRGNTKPECWMRLFMDNPELSYSMITDYSYS